MNMTVRICLLIAILSTCTCMFSGETRDPIVAPQRPFKCTPIPPSIEGISGCTFYCRQLLPRMWVDKWKDIIFTRDRIPWKSLVDACKMKGWSTEEIIRHY